MARMIYADKTRTLDAGKVNTLACKGKVMQSDLHLVGACSVRYDGAEIAAPAEGQTATLHCADRLMRSDVVVVTPACVLSGTWEWDEWFPEWPDEPLRQLVRFSTARGAYDAITIYPIDRVSYGTTAPVVVYEWASYPEWLDAAQRTITFDGEQPVTQAFYDWFTANATPV